jgi:CelD/BcsL family acetyltransferase involved in cellulose biosynthesis
MKAAAAIDARPHTSPSLTIEWLTSPTQIESISGQWAALEATVRNRTVLSTYDFLATWYRQYAGAYGGAPLIGLAWRGTRLVGVAPLTMRRGSVGRIPVTRVDFAPNDSPVGAFLVEDDHPETVAALLDSLVQSAKFDVVCLNGFDPESDHLLALRNAAAKHRLAIEIEDHAFAVADVSSGYQKYRSDLSGHYRRNLNQKARKLAAAGATVGGVQLTEGVDAMEDCLARMIAITEASYKLNGQRLADNHRGYLSELVRRFGPRGMLSLSILSIDGQDAAYLFGLVECGCFCDINLAYAESFAKFSPGAFLMHKTLESLAAAGVHTVISHGAHDYKKHWASAFVTQKRVFLFAPGARATATRFVRFGLLPVWRRFGAAQED